MLKHQSYGQIQVFSAYLLAFLVNSLCFCLVENFSTIGLTIDLAIGKAKLISRKVIADFFK